MPKHANITERLTMETTPSPVIPPGADNSRSELFAELRDLLLMLISVVLVLSFVKTSTACTDSSLPTNLGRNFTVEVFDRGKPVEGLQIELSTSPRTENEQSRTILIAKTDGRGAAEFKNIKPRFYYIGIKHIALQYSVEVKVMRRPPSDSSNAVTFQWPGWDPLSTQTVSGVLSGVARTNRDLILDLTKPVYTNVQGAKLTLITAVTAEMVDSQVTQESGKFEFKNVPPGLYFLRVETPVTNPPRWHYPEDGYIPVEVDPSAKLPNLDLQLDNAICGGLAGSRPKGNESVNAQTH